MSYRLDARVPLQLVFGTRCSAEMLASCLRSRSKAEFLAGCDGLLTMSRALRDCRAVKSTLPLTDILCSPAVDQSEEPVG